MQDASLLPITVVIDKSVIFMLATLSNATLQEVGINLMELADFCHRRLCNRGTHGFCARTKLMYPGTDVMINLSIKRTYNEVQIIADRKVWLTNFNTKFKTDYSIKDVGEDLWYDTPHAILNKRGIPTGVRSYVNKNKWPCTRMDKYECLKITAVIDKKQRVISFTKDDLDTYLIENILLREDDE